ncbi:sensor histidine kinase [Candidatus Solirubrobacter pratensis]|uniref:sensor histidine kinase n=1 Tax=Candidatus Solirubrobacter pratensis TaxID=1298857 RepID=UPI000406A695|nr:GAF domain-containing protein [Candidatus Solirubrobacter pratensis]
MTAQLRPRQVRAGAEIALAFAVGVASFAVVAVLLEVAESTIVAILLGVACIAAVIAVGWWCGTAYASPLAIAFLVAYDWYAFPPTHPRAFPGTEDLLNLVAYLAGAVLVGEIGAFASRRAERSDAARAVLAEEQAALRRVATLVARGVAPEQLFAAVVRELGHLLDADATHMGRYEPDGTAVGIASWSRAGDHTPIGTRAPVDGLNVASLVRQTRQPARMDNYTDVADPIASMLSQRGIYSSVGAPIVVDGRLWGVMLASSKAQDQPLPADTELRIAAFSELVSTAISNANARAETERLTDEQAALRRVATLVAEGSPPEAIFAAVAEEFGRLLHVDDMRMVRYEEHGTFGVIVGSWGAFDHAMGVGERMRIGGVNVASLVLESGRAARVDDFNQSDGPIGELARKAGVRSAVGAPILVDGRMWGAMVAASGRPQPLPASTEERLGQFTELVATAISNIQARADLDASRARLVEATDEERRRLVRDLHDGAQQRLVHTVITLKLALRAFEHHDGGVPALMREGIEQAEGAMVELRELAHGILPAALTSGGLRAGIDALVSRMSVPVELDVEPVRLPAAVESTAYFVVAEALTNVAKHSHASGATVAAHVVQHALHVTVCDDGVGGARIEGSGLQGLADRLAILHGQLTVESPAAGGTQVTAAIPIPADE